MKHPGASASKALNLIKRSVRAWLVQQSSRLDHWLQLDWRYYFKAGIWMSLAYVSSLLAGFLTSTVLSRSLTKDAYGRYGFVFTVMSLVSIAALPGLDAAITRSVARGYARSLVDGTRESIKWSLWGSVALLGTAIYYGLLRHDPQWQMLLIGAAAFPIMHGLRGVSAYFIGQKQFRSNAAYRIASELGVAVVVVGTVLITRSAALLVLASTIASSLVNVGFFLRGYREMGHAPSEHDPGLLAYGRTLTGITIVGSIAHHLDSILISALFGFADLAILSIARVFPDNSKAIAKSIQSLILPRFSRLTAGQVSQHAREKLLPLLLINWLAVIIAVLFTPLMTHLIYPNYPEAIRYTQWLFVSLAFIAPTLVIETALTSQQCAQQLYRGNLIFAITQIGSLLILVPTLGVLGAVVSRLLARFCLAAYYSYALWCLRRS